MSRVRWFYCALAAWAGMLVFRGDVIEGVALALCALVVALLTEPLVGR